MKSIAVVVIVEHIQCMSLPVNEKIATKISEMQWNELECSK